MFSETQELFVGDSVTVKDLQHTEDGYHHGTVIEVIRTDTSLTDEPCYVYDYRVQLDDGRIGRIEWGSWLEEFGDEKEEN